MEKQFCTFSFIFGLKKVWCNSIALFVLPDLQILETLIGVDRVDKLVNRSKYKRKSGLIHETKN